MKIPEQYTINTITENLFLFLDKLNEYYSDFSHSTYFFLITVCQLKKKKKQLN